MARDDETSEDSLRAPLQRAPREPGVVIIFAAGRPAALPLKIGSTAVEIGRGTPSGMLEDDDRISRKHVAIRRVGTRFAVTDLESRNGTFVDGRQLAESGEFAPPMLVRIGRSLLWAVEDVLPFFGEPPSGNRLEGPILGGCMRRVWGEIALAGRAGDTLYICGESGAGKELAARAFHEAHFAAQSTAPFVAVNCAAIPEGLAERLLFGARKGAYSGATTDAEGYVQAAHGGTLFLDEIAELDPQVQAKLLRVLESREVLPLGAARSRKVEIRICTASHKGLRDEVRAGRFREDLYFRLGRPEVVVPPLRERLDEIPWLVARELGAVDARLAASVTLIEACALGAWPGNVRELLREVRRAAHRALEEGETVVQPHHLAPEAGTPLGASASAPPPAIAGTVEPARPTTVPPAAKLATAWSDEQITRALAENGGNVRGTARALGMHRNQLRRWLEKHPEVVVDASDASSPSDDS
jgi:DNA-binding NtrC family response regulator